MTHAAKHVWHLPCRDGKLILTTVSSFTCTTFAQDRLAAALVAGLDAVSGAVPERPGAAVMGSAFGSCLRFLLLEMVLACMITKSMTIQVLLLK